MTTEVSIHYLTKLNCYCQMYSY